jgi:hypothetical protein
VPTGIRRSPGPPKLLPAHLLSPTPKYAYELRKSGLSQLVIDLFETDDVKEALASAVHALENGTPRPDLDFAGH